MPGKPNGKIDYDALPYPLAEEETQFQPPRDDVEKKIRELWAHILGKEIKHTGVTRSFFELGGNSLNTMALISTLHKEFDIRISLGEIFTNPTIEKQAAFVRKMKGRGYKERFKSIEPVEKKEYHILSSAQKRLYFIQQL
ncbi:MAG: hypothetical protein GY950_12445, partial [bacterium]|nr:hypothetical protein [bacterium]